nr:uncharacterized protein LOC125180337 [Anser cygnoides]
MKEISPSLPRFGADYFARPHAAPFPAERSPRGAQRGPISLRLRRHREPGRAAGLPCNAPRPCSIPSSRSFGPFAPGHFSAAARGNPRQPGGSPRRLLPPASPQAGFKHPGSAPSWVPEGRRGGEGLTCSPLLPFLLCWWRGRAHGCPRRCWGLCGGSVGKWFWFNGPLARPGDSALYVILSFITYTCDQRLPLPLRSFSRFPFGAEPGRAARTGGIPVPSARCPPLVPAAGGSQQERKTAARHGLPRRSGFDPKRREEAKNQGAWSRAARGRQPDGKSRCGT